jgi:hypothetical protein
MSLSNDIQDAIKKSLPSAVAGELQAFIEEAKQNKANLDLVIKERNAKEVELQRLRGIETREANIAAREAAARIKDHDLQLKESVLKAQEEFNNRRVDEMRNLVSTVFGSNRLNYNLNLSVPVKDQYGNTMNYPASGDITKEK